MEAPDRETPGDPPPRGTWRSHRAAALLFVLLSAACAPSPPPPPGSFVFGVFGDGPYSGHEVPKGARLVDLLNREELEWVLNVGDILWYPCSDEMIESRFRLFQKIRHPFIYIPGDNEWSDCHGAWEGGYEPLDRLRVLRRVFFADPASSTGGRRIPLISQSTREGWSEFVEHARWTHQGVVFMTVHIVGGRNGREPFEGRTAAADDEAGRREQAAIAWIREGFAAASEAPAVVVAFHADMTPGDEPGSPDREGFEGILEALEEEASRFNRPVLLIHGDSHTYIVDRPLVSRATGDLLDNVQRLEVAGSPEIGWVRVTVTPGRREPFSFDRRTVRLGAVWW